MSIATRRLRGVFPGFIGTLTGTDTARTTVRGLSGRVRQAVRLHAYKIQLGVDGSGIIDRADSVYVVGILQAIERDWGIEASNWVFTGLGNHPNQSIVDVQWRLLQAENASPTPNQLALYEGFNDPGGWVYTDILVPELHLHLAAETVAVGSASVGGRLLVEYEWVDVSLDEIAAINLAWGRDPVDFDRG